MCAAVYAGVAGPACAKDLVDIKLPIWDASTRLKVESGQEMPWTGAALDRHATA